MSVHAKRSPRSMVVVWIVVMSLWIAAACAIWSATFTGLLWLHVYMQRNHGWKPLAESFPWASAELILAILGIGCAIAAAGVVLLGNRGVLPEAWNGDGA